MTLVPSSNPRPHFGHSQAVSLSAAEIFKNLFRSVCTFLSAVYGVPNKHRSDGYLNKVILLFFTDNLRTRSELPSNYKSALKYRFEFSSKVTTS